ncbi:helix-turn-helix transcriptional regulator [Streptomyces sp. NPDC091027]|uniref:helix-turn-helix transcriptional regulator n=1 Tax=Streptomyces sp. NPDC091027 TaxID=3365971 RepID=UPI00382B799E
MEEITEWLRPEFQGKESDLVSLREVAQEVGISPNTVYSWQRRHANFPKIVKLVRGQATTKYISRREFAAYKEARRDAPAQPRRSNAPRRPAEVIAQEKLHRLKNQDMKLAAQEKDLAEQLADILRQRHAINKEMQDTKQSLKAALERIQAALGDEEP